MSSSASYYVKGHLLSSWLHGPGMTWENLTPLTRRANALHESRVERPIYDHVRAGDVKKRKIVHYKVEPTYGRGLNSTSISEIDNELAKQISDASEPASTDEPFFTSKLRVPITLAFLIAFFNQLSGINAVLYFAPRIFEMTGLAKEAALLQSVGIGVTNLVFTFVGLWLIDRLGRRTLLFVGSIGYIASLGLCAWAFFTGTFSIVPPPTTMSPS